MVVQVVVVVVVACWGWKRDRESERSLWVSCRRGWREDVYVCIFLMAVALRITVLCSAS